jgi:hypothetical protein
LHTGSQTQGLWNTQDSGSPDVFARDDVNRGRDFGEFFFPLGDGSDLDLRELLEGKVGEHGRLGGRQWHGPKTRQPGERPDRLSEGKPF